MVADRLEAAVGARGTASLVLAGGSTPRGSYGLLARAPLPWRQIHLYFGDERCVPPGHEESNYRMARETLIDPAGVPAESVHRIEAERDPEEAAAAYARDIVARLGPRPAFDVVLLGMGADGHTASLFPGSSVLDERSRLVAAARVAKLPTPRVTLTLPAFEGARAVLFLVTGADKAPALARALAGRADPGTPASCIRSGGEVVWLVDAAAASALGETTP